ncbi:hypothetical protein CGJ05_23285, partial [Vibrio parahaemolyticus]|uniref:type VI secretion system baseplate subunit TssF n=1 Tax=Vibrio parahaemolyticus TaxID=670 RepID=UPI00116D7A33
PSMSVIKLNCSESTTSSFSIPVGERVEVSAPGYQDCQFRTGYPTTMYPLDIISGSFENAPFKPTGSKWEHNAHSVLRCQLSAHDSESSINSMGIDCLRLYLNG